MPGSGTGTFTEPDDYQANLRQMRIDLLGTSQGAFKARLTWVTPHHLDLQRCEEDLPRIAYVSLASALVFIGFSTRPDPPMQWGGTKLHQGISSSTAAANGSISGRPALATGTWWDWLRSISNYMVKLSRERRSRCQRLRGSCAPPRATRHGCAVCTRRPVASPRPGPKFWPTPRSHEP